jgi:hypothetical protein
MVMKKSQFILVIAILFTSCATTNKMANKAFYHALVGQNEMTVYSRLGAPTNIVTSGDGGRILIYEFYTKGMFVVPEVGEPTGNSLGFTDKKTGAIYDIKTYSNNNSSSNISYLTDVNSLVVFIDQQGNCVRFEQDLPREKLEFYYNRLKGYIPQK